MGAVDVAVLVGEAVARVVPDHLDGLVQLVRTADAGVGLGELRAVVHGLGPHEGGKLGLDGVLALRDLEAGKREGRPGVAGAAALDAHVAGQDLKHADGAAGLLAVLLALGAKALLHAARLGGGNLAREVDDALLGNAADGRGPSRGLCRLVLALAADVGLVGLLGVHTLGHVVLVVAQGVLLQEVVVHQVLGDHDVGHGIDQGRVRARANGNPLVGEGGRRGREARVHHVDPGTARLQAVLEVVGVGGAAQLVLAAVVAEEHHELGVLHVGGVVALAAAVQVRHGGLDLRGGVAAVIDEAAAVQVEEALQEVLDVLGPGARGVDGEDGLSTVGVQDAPVVVSDGLCGLVPADLLELAGTTVARATQRVFQAVLVVDPLAQAATVLAGADLAVLEGIVTGVVGLDLGDLAVLDVQAKRAAAVAVGRAMAPDDLVVLGSGLRGRALARSIAACEARAHGGRGTTSRGTLDEAATRNVHGFAHVLSPVSYARHG